MPLISPHIALVRTGSACKHDDDPEHARIWLKQNHNITADFHPQTQSWLSPKQRAEILLDYLLDDNYQALWAFRGGEGTADILPFIHAQAQQIKQAKPKLIIGFSDLTALLNYFNKEYQWPVIHGPNIIQTARGLLDERTVNATLPFLYDLNAPLLLNELQAFNDLAKEPGRVQSKLCGGNLSVLAINFKDIWEVSTEGKIVILEDIDERPHKIARNLNYFQRVGFFSQVQALIFGDFIYHHEEEQHAIIRTLHRFADICDFPVLHTTEFGHGKHNMPLPFYREAELILGDKPSLEFVSPLLAGEAAA